MKDFKNKVAVVTGGGGSGIGNHLVVELAKKGAKIAFCDIADIEKTLADIKPYNTDVYSEKVDMGNKEAIKRFVKNVIHHFGGINLLINNAGIALGDISFDKVSEQDFEKITNINYWGVVYSTQFFYPYLLKEKEAAIVNLSSSQGILALPYLVPYCTTKFAVRGFTDALRVENSVRGIKNVTVHTVHPGRVATDITLHADYSGPRTNAFHNELQAGTSAQKAAEIILKGVQKNKARIFISDGKLQDLVARIFPSHVDKIAKFVMKLKKLPTN